MSNIYDICAIKIQNAWKLLQYRKTFSSLKKLIEFKLKGQPSILLKSINPNEAKLLDCAAQAHCRFRLGGSVWPPNIYYKIYTHGSIIDINAFAPREYNRLKKSNGLSKRLKRLFDKDKEGMKALTMYQDKNMNGYVREENNGWRKINQDFFYDDIEIDTHTKKKAFKHFKYQRRDEVEQKKKLKRILWLQKMFSIHPPDSSKQQSDTANLDEVIQNISVLDDDLLNWAEELDFENYTREWFALGCSSISEMQSIEIFIKSNQNNDSMEIPNLPSTQLLMNSVYERNNMPPNELLFEEEYDTNTGMNTEIDCYNQSSNVILKEDNEYCVSNTNTTQTKHIVPRFRRNHCNTRSSPSKNVELYDDHIFPDMLVDQILSLSKTQTNFEYRGSETVVSNVLNDSVPVDRSLICSNKGVRIPKHLPIEPSRKNI